MEFSYPKTLFLYVFRHIERYGELETPIYENRHYRELNYVSYFDILENGIAAIPSDPIKRIAFVYRELTNAHLIPDGNKQFAYFFLKMAFEYNSWEIKEKDTILLEFALKVAKNECEVDDIVEFIEKRLVPK